MKLKLWQIKEMKEPLERLITQTIPIKIAFRLNKVINLFQENFQLIETSRVNLVKSLSVEGKDGAYSVPKNKMGEFQVQYGELMSEEVEFPFEIFNIDDFAAAEITTEDMIKISALFEE